MPDQRRNCGNAQVNPMCEPLISKRSTHFGDVLARPLRRAFERFIPFLLRGVLRIAAMRSSAWSTTVGVRSCGAVKNFDWGATKKTVMQSFFAP